MMQKSLRKVSKLEVLGKEKNYFISCAVDYKKYFRQQAYGILSYFLSSFRKTLREPYTMSTLVLKLSSNIVKHEGPLPLFSLRAPHCSVTPLLCIFVFSVVFCAISTYPMLS